MTTTTVRSPMASSSSRSGRQRVIPDPDDFRADAALAVEQVLDRRELARAMHDLVPRRFVLQQERISASAFVTF